MPFDWQILLHKLAIDLEWELEDMGLEPTTQIKSDYAAFCWNEFHEPYYTTRNLLYYAHLATFKAFGRGWMVRLFETHQRCLTWDAGA